MVLLIRYTCAFLENNQEFLLLKRSPTKDVNPNFWSGVGGKIEAEEHNNPYAACLREIQEETGIAPTQLEDLTLRYIIVRRHGNVIRESNVYFGKTTTRDFVDSPEGTLQWVSKEKLGEMEFTATFVEMIRHYLSPLAEEDQIMVGVAQKVDGGFQMNWSKLESFEGE